MKVSAANYFLVSHEPYVETINQFCRLVMLIMMMILIMTHDHDDDNLFVDQNYDHENYNDSLVTLPAVIINPKLGPSTGSKG